jgi:DNA invertase Pin-like site-specific DNA recombinase
MTGTEFAAIRRSLGLSVVEFGRLCKNAKSCTTQRDMKPQANSCANMRCEMIVGYARVSTDGQTLDAQQAALKAAGVERVYAEKISGAKSDRLQLTKMLKMLAEDDTVVVTRLDRLARSTRDLLNILHVIGKAGATFKSLADAWADTTTPHGRLMLTILGGLAEFERDLIKARTDDGRRRAMARGVRFGRKVKLTPHQIAEALRRRDAGEALTEIAKTYNVSHSTISRLPPSPRIHIRSELGLEAQPRPEKKAESRTGEIGKWVFRLSMFKLGGRTVKSSTPSPLTGTTMDAE